jgi:hypothetical protein
VWEKFDQLRYRWKFNKHNWPSDSKSFLKYYAGFRNRVFDNLAEYADVHFPDISQQLHSKEQLKLFFSNYQDLPQLWQDFPNAHWTGTSGYFRFTLVKKLGFWRHSTDRRRGWWKFSMIPNVKDLYDKYRSNEDQRSSYQ